MNRIMLILSAMAFLVLTTGCTQATKSTTVTTPVTKVQKATKKVKGEKQLQAVHAFIQNHLIGKTLGYEIKKKYRQDTKYVESTYRMTYDGLERTAKGIKFQERFAVKSTKWKLDSTGNKIGEGKNKDRVATRYYEATGNGFNDDINGFMRLVPEGKEDMTGKNMRVLSVLKVKEGKLYMRQHLPNFSACTAPDGSKKAGADESDIVFEVIEGKVKKTTVLKRYEVDTETFKRTVCKEKPISTYIANEL